MIPKLMPFDYYLRNKDVVNRSADPGAARSMIEKAEKRYRFITTLTIDEDNATFIFEEIYTVIRECAQCLMMADGYNSKYSHEAPIAFISENIVNLGISLLLSLIGIEKSAMIRFIGIRMRVYGRLLKL